MDPPFLFAKDRLKKMMEVIKSRSNAKLRKLRRLSEKKYRLEEGLFTAEGEDLLDMAVECGQIPEVVFFDVEYEEALKRSFSALPATVEKVPVEREALDSASSLGSGSRLIGVWRQRWSDINQMAGGEVVVYLHDLTDPSNVGSVMRSASTLARSSIALSEKCADPYSAKAVRASMGSIFSQPLTRTSLNDLLHSLGHEYKAVALVPGRGEPLYALDLSGKTLLCIGSERDGLPGEIVELCGAICQIPMQEGSVGSLNVAQAASIALYQCLLHRIGVYSEQRG